MRPWAVTATPSPLLGTGRGHILSCRLPWGWCEPLYPAEAWGEPSRGWGPEEEDWSQLPSTLPAHEGWKSMRMALPMSSPQSPTCGLQLQECCAMSPVPCGSVPWRQRGDCVNRPQVSH